MRKSAIEDREEESKILRIYTKKVKFNSVGGSGRKYIHYCSLFTTQDIITSWLGIF
jgi:hypothetical protein